MKLPEESIIAVAKITDYLLKPNLRGDKAKFLEMGGYTMNNWAELETAIRNLLQLEAIFQKTDDFGDYYEISGNLNTLQVKTIWLWEHGSDVPRFITLFPYP